LKAELTDAADFFRVKRDGSREGVFPPSDVCSYIRGAR
jgi:hypothetical protein